MFLGDEGRAEIEDDALDLTEQRVAGGVFVVAAGHLELDLADRPGVDSLVVEQLEQPVPIGNPRRLDLNRCHSHLSLLFRIRKAVYPVRRAEKPPVLDPQS